MEETSNIVHYNAGITAAKFHQSPAEVRGIMGPVGTGKTVACINEIVRLAILQEPYQGKRQSKWLIVRNTYGELINTTIETWNRWYGYYTKVVISGCPIRGVTIIPLSDGTIVELKLVFMAADTESAGKHFKSVDATGVFINEACELLTPERINLFDIATSRKGRYPDYSKLLGKPGPTRECILLDTNPPPDTNYYYRFAETINDENWEFFRIPPALVKKDKKYKPKEGEVCKKSLEGTPYIGSPNAECVEHHKTGIMYWLKLVVGKSDSWISVMLLGNYGYIQTDTIVYGEYVDALHCSPTILKPIVGVPLILGWDYGLTPACVICQFLPSGQFRIIDELYVTLKNTMGTRQFSETMVLPHLKERYSEWLLNGQIFSAGDKVGTYRDQSEAKTCVMILDEVLGKYNIQTQSSYTNLLTPRLDTVKRFLKRTIDGNPGLLLSPNCEHARSGFLGGYTLKKDTPDKSIYSHIQDAIQYATMAVEREDFKNVEDEEPQRTIDSMEVRDYKQAIIDNISMDDQRSLLENHPDAWGDYIECDYIECDYIECDY